MRYLLLAWSQGSCAASARLSIDECPYSQDYEDVIMKNAWIQGFNFSNKTAGGVRQLSHHYSPRKRSKK